MIRFIQTYIMIATIIILMIVFVIWPTLIWQYIQWDIWNRDIYNLWLSIQFYWLGAIAIWIISWWFIIHEDEELNKKEADPEEWAQYIPMVGDRVRD